MVKEYNVYLIEEMMGTYTEVYCRTYDNQEQAVDKVAELRAQGFNAFYEFNLK